MYIMHSITSVLFPAIGISWIFWLSLESCNENFFDGWKLSLSIILRIFLIFGNLSLDDSYKLDSYKKKCVFLMREGNFAMSVSGRFQRIMTSLHIVATGPLGSCWNMIYWNIQIMKVAATRIILLRFMTKIKISEGF